MRDLWKKVGFGVIQIALGGLMFWLYVQISVPFLLDLALGVVFGAITLVLCLLVSRWFGFDELVGEALCLIIPLAKLIYTLVLYAIIFL